ncbi:MAG: hypothetical protein DMG23_10190 [Acidobacteria bacterium]|nr:MAG: hypothetical protein DMG23_10190 [Acidobacteriota bacterium]
MSDYTFRMRGQLLNLAKFLIVAFALSIFMPLLLCGGGSFTKAEASNCCRALQFECQQKDGAGACGKHQTITPVHLAVTSASELAPPQPLTLIGLAPVLSSGDLLRGQVGHHLFNLFPRHFPPEAILSLLKTRPR